MVVCPEPPAAQVGASIYAAGGNAADAAVAAAFAQAVTNPLLCGIGGGGIMQVYDHKTQRRIVLNCEVTIGSVEPPASWATEFRGRAETVGRFVIESEENQVGHRSIMIPGFVRGCWELHTRFGSGKISWSELLAPSVQLARQGFEVYDYVADSMRTTKAGDETADRPGYPGLNAKLNASADAREIVLKPDGSSYTTGDVFTQPDYANCLQRIADAGADDFYQGDIAAQIDGDFRAMGALIGRSDMRDYEVELHEPIQSRYRGIEVSTTPLASTGPQLIEMLKVLEHFDLANYELNSPAYIDLLARIQRCAFSDSVQFRGTEFAYGMGMVDQIISDGRASYWADRIARGDRIIVSGGGVDPGTTHLVAVDGDRNVVTFTHSIGSIAGSGVVTPSLGFLFNNFLGQYNPIPGNPDSIEPGKRFGGGVPTILFDDGLPILAIGAPGGSRIITSVWQVIVDMLDFGVPLDRAVELPRFHSEERSLIIIERQFDEHSENELRQRGNDVKRSDYMSRVQAIAVTPQGLVAGADPRGGRGVGRFVA